MAKIITFNYRMVSEWLTSNYMEGSGSGLIWQFFGFIRKTTSCVIEKKNVFTLHIPPWAPHTYDFVVLTSLTHPRKILLVVLQIGKVKDLSAPLRIPAFAWRGWGNLRKPCQIIRSPGRYLNPRYSESKTGNVTPRQDTRPYRAAYNDISANG
jgi:hypothetical protein